MCEARTHVCAGLHTTLGGHLSLREALLGPNRARDPCPQRLLALCDVCAMLVGRKGETHRENGEKSM